MAIQVRPIQAAEIEAARRLLAASGWATRVADAARFRQMVERSQLALVAVAGGEVVGFIRALTDGISNGYIAMLVVASAHRRKGVGRALAQAVLGDDPRITWVLRAGREGAAAFWEKAGFARSQVAMELRRAEARETPAVVEGAKKGEI